MSKILALDIETAYALAGVWRTGEQYVSHNQILRPPYMICWCASWYGDKQVMSDSLVNYPTHYKKDPTCDKKITASIRELMDEADVIITQNGDNFDLKWLNSLFLKHKIPPPSPYKSIDTLKVSRKHFYTVSQKLDYRGKELGIGEKMEHEGFGLWIKCLAGVKSAWVKMVQYCKRDVILLKDYAEILMPYIKTITNLNVYESGGCVGCGSKSVWRRGFFYTNTAKFQRYQCKSCGKWMRDKESIARAEYRSV